MNGENGKFYTDDNLFILGKWFALERKQKDYSIRGLSRAANMTASLISDIENQKIKPNLDTLKQLYQQLDIPFITEPDQLTAVQENIVSLYYAIYDQNEDVIQNLTFGLNAQIESLRYSPVTVDILITEGFVSMLNQDESPPKAFFALENHLDYLSLVQKERYWIALGYHQMRVEAYEEALKSFKKAIECHREGRGYAVSHQSMASIYSRMFNPIKAIEYAAKASRYHAKWSNIIRKIETDFIQIKSYIELNQLEAAEALIKNLSYVLVESDQRQWFELKSLEAYMAFKKDDYERCLKILKKIPVHHFYLKLLSLQSYQKTHQEDLVSTVYQSLTSEYPAAKEPLKYAITQVVYHGIKKDSKETDEAYRYILDHINEVEEYDVLKDLVIKGTKAALVNKQLDTLAQWVEISQKLMNFHKIKP